MPALSNDIDFHKAIELVEAESPVAGKVKAVSSGPRKVKLGPPTKNTMYEAVSIAEINT
jgi:hypothetical protein